MTMLYQSISLCISSSSSLLLLLLLLRQPANKVIALGKTFSDISYGSLHSDSNAKVAFVFHQPFWINTYQLNTWVILSFILFCNQSSRYQLNIGIKVINPSHLENYWLCARIETLFCIITNHYTLSHPFIFDNIFKII